MFLDEELEQIYNKDIDYKSKLLELFKAMANRTEDPQKCSVEKYLLKLKQIDNSWRLFCKNHDDLCANGFRDLVLKRDDTGKIKEFLHW
jgi:hypothetical protein